MGRTGFSPLKIALICKFLRVTGIDSAVERSITRNVSELGFQDWFLGLLVLIPVRLTKPPSGFNRLFNQSEFSHGMLLQMRFHGFHRVGEK